jgi:mycobactin peptide synthetase MbtE
VHDGTSLAGYVVPQQPIDGDAAKAAFANSVRAAVTTALPAYMVPSSLTVLGALPKTESGKLNRPGLRRPAVSTSGQTEPARTETERALAAVFADLLSTSDVGRFDDFFALGGDSILSVQLASRARAVGLNVNPRMVFENPTVEQLAASIDSLGDTADDESQPSETRFEPMTTSGLSPVDLAAVTQLWSKSRDGTP